MARPGIEPRTSDLRVRCPTDCDNVCEAHLLIHFYLKPILGIYTNSADLDLTQQNVVSDQGLHGFIAGN